MPRNRVERLALHRALAETDGLTGVQNRQASTQALERLLRLAERYEQPLALATIDLDRFKQVNDVHGHAAGDAVLRRFGTLLLESFRGEDVVGRWGGEELLSACTGCRATTPASGSATCLRRSGGSASTAPPAPRSASPSARASPASRRTAAISPRCTARRT